MTAPETQPEVQQATQPETAKIPAQRTRSLTATDVFGPPVRTPVIPLPPAPDRRLNREVRIAILIGVIALVISLVVVPVIVFNESQSSGTTALPAPATTADPTGDSAAKPSASPVEPGSVEAINAELSKQSAALLRGDEKGWLAPIDPKAKAAITAYRRIFHNMRAMHVAIWTQNDPDDDLTGEVSTSATLFSIDVSYCLVVRTCTETTAELNVTGALKHGVVRIGSLVKPTPDARTNQPLPWQVATLSAVVGPRVVVAASSAEAGRLRSVLPIAVAAAAVDDRFALWGRPNEYVLYLADSTEFRHWFAAGVDGEDLGVEVTVSPSDLEAMVRLPAASTDRGASGLRGVVQHEFGHVATLQGTSATTDNSLIEGMADYCAAVGHPSWENDSIYAARIYIRRGEWSKKIYLTKQIESGSLITANAAYAIGYLGLHYLTNTYGQSKMLTFWGDVEHHFDSLNHASEAVFHKSWTSVNADAVRYIDQEVGV